MRTRNLTSLVVAGLVAALPLTSAGATATTVAPGTFSTSPRVVHRSPEPAPHVIAIRVGHHATFDRIVIQLAGSHAPGFDVSYVSHLTADPSGKTVNLLGASDLALDGAHLHEIADAQDLVRKDDDSAEEVLEALLRRERHGEAADAAARERRRQRLHIAAACALVVAPRTHLVAHGQARIPQRIVGDAEILPGHQAGADIPSEGSANQKRDHAGHGAEGKGARW